MPIHNELIKRTLNNAIASGAQVRNEQILKRYNFFHVPSEGVWVKGGNKVYVDGANWLFYHPKDAMNKPSFTGAGAGTLQEVLVSL